MCCRGQKYVRTLTQLSYDYYYFYANAAADDDNNNLLINDSIKWGFCARI
jgi:hypothetical protein